LVELLKQPQYSPYSVERQVVSIWSGTSGHLDDVPVEDIRRFETEFLDHVASKHQGVYDSILTTGDLGDDEITVLEQAIDEFKKGFQTTSGEGIHAHAGREEHDAMDDDEVGQEQVKKYKRSAPAEKKS
jgi:F-type H+-transporting ATPase subunit alpha